ncbi:MAG: preprotein translocase subunit SecA, partial [Candidimonas sp.]
FSSMLERIRDEVVKTLLTVKIQSAEEEMAEAEPVRLDNVTYHHSDYDEALSGTDPGLGEIIGGSAGVAAGGLAIPKVGRNDPCPCGSGKKYKHCHGRLV